jgi:hypothetical protein
LEASCGVVLSRKTLKFGGDAFGDSLSGPLVLSGGADWYIQESDMVEMAVGEELLGFTAVSLAGLTPSVRDRYVRARWSR